VAKLTDEHGNNQHLAAHLLAKLAPDSLPAVRKAAASENPRIRLGAARALGSLKPLPTADLPLLLALARDPHKEVRRAAVYALGPTGSASPPILKALSAALDDPDTAHAAAEALGQIGPAAAPALPLLEKQLKSAEPLDRVALAGAIWRINSKSRLVFPILTEILKDTRMQEGGYYASTKMVEGKRIQVTRPIREPVAMLAVRALGEMGPAAAPAVPALLKAARGDNEALTGSVIHALGRIGPAAREAVPFLSEQAASERPFSAEADYALRHIAPEAAQGPQRIFDAVPAGPE
jgi:HEAT repeat protein